MKLKIPTIEKTVENMIDNAYKYVAIYARESNKGYKSGLETQVITNKRYAAENNLLVYDVYEEFISASQKNYKMRSEFLRLIKDAEKGCFKKIIVTKRDRLTRRFEDYIDIKNTFKELGIEILYSNDVQLTETKDYASNFIENLIMAVAELEPQNIRERILAGMKVKRGERTYDKRAAFGHYRDKIKNQYVKDGIKAEIVQNIFDIYLDTDDVKNPQDIKVKLRLKSEGKGEEYINEVYKLDNTKIESIISRPIYAGLQTKYLEYKYEDFKIEYDEEILDLDIDHFHSCTNVDALIKPFEWLAAANKWVKYNGYRSDKKVRNIKPRKEKNLFSGMLYCKQCFKSIKSKGDFFQCETKNCIKIRKDKFIKNLIERLFEKLIFGYKIDSVLEVVISELSQRKRNCKKQLVNIIKNQSADVESYLKDNSNKKLRESILTANDDQLKIKKEIEELENKIVFLEQNFKSIILPIMQSDYVTIIIDDLVNNHPAILEMLLNTDIREILIDGKAIKIKQR
ncbi:recombinase family protein [Clostridium sp. A1-XYC3]|uniref:Recombinase family protein n=1 Tax=Clostridium tanneri TaxID=3037988 RepID=A0ABU4JWW4_9CLOT|nr:recombinase family protein [Clostridium sp. A1-XYC3]MDW8802642.1 recombinase family protein [Clostridium sp. A1-XYC3]